jgi:hypothetical protein
VRFPVTLVPRGAIRPDLGLRLRMRDKVVPGKGAGPGGCQIGVAGYLVQGGVTYNPTDGAYDWVCGFAWTATVTAFVIKCDKVVTWAFETGGFFTGTPPSAVEGVDDQGRPTLTISGFADDCADFVPIVRAHILLDGAPVSGDPGVELRKTVPPFRISFDGADGGGFQNLDAGALSWGLSQSGTTIFVLPHGIDGYCEVWLVALDAPIYAPTCNWSWSVVAGGSPDWTVTAIEDDSGTSTPNNLHLALQFVGTGAGNDNTVTISASASPGGPTTDTWTISSF